MPSKKPRHNVYLSEQQEKLLDCIAAHDQRFEEKSVKVIKFATMEFIEEWFRTHPNVKRPK